MTNYQKSHRLLIVILNWNSPRDTLLCINSLELQITNDDQILVVDNDSSDDSVSFLQEAFPKMVILQNESNLGFQGGMNVGLNYARNGNFKFVMIVNSDTVASPNMLCTLFASMPDKAAIVSPGIYYMNEQSKLCFSGGDINPILLDMVNKARIDENSDPIKLEFLPSHAWLIRVSVIDQVGLLDEDYFPLYYDDLDYCLRLKRKNYSLYLVPKAKLFHTASSSVGGRNSPKERYLMARNSGYYFRKNMAPWQYPIIFLFRLISCILWTCRLAINRKAGSIFPYWKGFAAGWFGKLPAKTKPNPESC